MRESVSRTALMAACWLVPFVVSMGVAWGLAHIHLFQVSAIARWIAGTALGLADAWVAISLIWWMRDRHWLEYWT